MGLIVDTLCNMWQLTIALFFIYLILFPIGWYFIIPGMNLGWMFLYIPHLALAKSLYENEYI